MSRLTVYRDTAPDKPISVAEDAAAIAAALKAIGVRFERWQSPVKLTPDDDADKILAAYRPYRIPASVPKSMHPLMADGKENYLPTRYHSESKLVETVNEELPSATSVAV